MGKIPPCRSKNKINHNYFENIDSDKKAYFLGFIMADGCITTPSPNSKNKSSYLVTRIQKRDDYIIESLNKEITPYKNLYFFKYKNPNRQEQSIHAVYSNKVCEDLGRLGVTPRKSGNESFPNIPKSLIGAFTRGYMDGDGCVYIRKEYTDKKGKVLFSNIVKFVCLSKSFLEELKNNLNNIGNIRKIERKNCRTVYEYAILRKKDLAYFYDLIYKDATIFLKRKKDKFLERYTKLNEKFL